ncbi:hypothetical protein [Undibacterium oligocarboniphilum]|nr:hypothetical protein [Undibacterium oligocarboniphilum]
MRTDIFSEYPFGQIALRKLAPVSANFRLYAAGWLGNGKVYDVMSVTGAEFREAKSGDNQGKLCIKIPNTSRTVHVTAEEMRKFDQAGNKNSKA